MTVKLAALILLMNAITAKADDKTFSFVSTNGITREAAAKDAKAKNGSLAELRNDSEVQTALQLVGSKAVWIGGARSNNSWQWIDGSSITNLTWVEGSPRNKETFDFLIFNAPRGNGDASGAIEDQPSSYGSVTGYLMEIK